MKTLTFLTAALLAAPLAAQSYHQGGESRIQVHGEFSRPREIAIPMNPSGEIKDQAENQVGFGLRFMGELPGLNNWYYELGGRLESSSKYATKPSAATNNTDTTFLKFKYSYWTVGGAYMWSLSPGLNLGAHLEVRGESLNASGDYSTVTPTLIPVDVSTTYVRPWARLSLDYAFKAAGTSPFIGFDAAVAILKTTQDTGFSPFNWDDKALKSQAPQFSMSVYLGMKF